MNQNSSAHSIEGGFARGVKLEQRWTLRLRAFGLHLAVSILVAATVLAWVYLGWYRSPLGAISGVGEVLLLLIAVDVILGPMLTLVVFDRRKKSLPLDLTCIAVMQLMALLYGLYTIESGRPHYLVFVKDRFEFVSTADLQPQDRAAAQGNAAARVSWFGPRIVSAEMPSSAKEREDILLESISGGRDLHHFPDRYRAYEAEASLAARKAKPIAQLRLLNPGADFVLEAALAPIDVPESRVGFLPIKGPVGDATMLVDASSGAILGMVQLQPWR